MRLVSDYEQIRAGIKLKEKTHSPDQIRGIGRIGRLIIGIIEQCGLDAAPLRKGKKVSETNQGTGYPFSLHIRTVGQIIRNIQHFQFGMGKHLIKQTMPSEKAATII